MPTNDERREVAVRLREHQHGDVRYPTFESGMIASWLRLKEALGAEGDDPQEDHTMMFGYLAGLIEPEPERTCRNLEKQSDSIVFKCSACGHLDFQDFDWEEMVPKNWNFCPNCGARVKEGE